MMNLRDQIRAERDEYLQNAVEYARRAIEAAKVGNHTWSKLYKDHADACRAAASTLTGRLLRLEEAERREY